MKTQLQADFAHGLNFRNRLHAAAYLKAAGHFLSSWPQEWSALRLYCALRADPENREEMIDRGKINFWQAIYQEGKKQDVEEDAEFFIESLIYGLAEDFIIFMIDNIKA